MPDKIEHLSIDGNKVDDQNAEDDIRLRAEKVNDIIETLDALRATLKNRGRI